MFIVLQVTISSNIADKNLIAILFGQVERITHESLLHLV